jgi:hypothetical protein
LFQKILFCNKLDLFQAACSIIIVFKFIIFFQLDSAPWNTGQHHDPVGSPWIPGNEEPHQHLPGQPGKNASKLLFFITDILEPSLLKYLGVNLLTFLVS